jgi:hypothetical protein
MGASESDAAGRGVVIASMPDHPIDMQGECGLLSLQVKGNGKVYKARLWAAQMHLSLKISYQPL